MLPPSASTSSPEWRVLGTIRRSNPSLRTNFLQHVLFVCLNHVDLESKSTASLLARDENAWWQCFENAAYREPSEAHKWEQFLLGQLFRFADGCGSDEMVSMPDTDPEEEVSFSQITEFLSSLFNVKLSPLKKVAESQMAEALAKSPFFQSTAIPEISKWYDHMTIELPVELPYWHHGMPPELSVSLGVRSMQIINRLLEDAAENCPSLFGLDYHLLLVMANISCYAKMTRTVLDEWSTSKNGQENFKDLLKTFYSTREVYLATLVLSILLQYPAYHTFPCGLDEQFKFPIKDGKATLEQLASSFRFVSVNQQQSTESQYVNRMVETAVENRFVGKDESMEKYWKGRLILGLSHESALKEASGDQRSDAVTLHEVEYQSPEMSQTTLVGHFWAHKRGREANSMSEGQGEKEDFDLQQPCTRGWWDSLLACIGIPVSH